MANSKRILACICGLFLAIAVSCAPVYRNHGYVPDDADLESVIVGVDTRDSVEELLGLPTTGGVTKSDGFYYISSRWRHFTYNKPKPIEREIVAINFDNEGVVTNISRYGLEDGRVVVLSRRVTSGGAGEISFIRQLMGDFGRVDAGQIFGET